jgi:hypothetical protein
MIGNMSFLKRAAKLDIFGELQKEVNSLLNGLLI